MGGYIGQAKKGEIVNGYKVYLTKSKEVAKLIGKAYKNTENIESINWNSADGRIEVPGIYKGKDYFVCIITFKNQDKEFFDLIIA